MKTIFGLIAAVLLLGSPLAWSAPNAAEYTVTIHVVSSHIETEYWGQTQIPDQTLNVLIDGKKYELEGTPISVSSRTFGLIVPGDYKAKLLPGKHKGTYAYAEGYELLFPDQTTAKFAVVGESE